MLVDSAKKKAEVKGKVTTDNESVCPITLAPFSQLKHPCVASDGGVYEREALETWARRNPSSPLNRELLSFGVPFKLAQKAVSRAVDPAS